MEDYSLALVRGSGANGTFSLAENELSNTEIFHLFEAALREGNLKTIKHLNEMFPERKCRVLSLQNEHLQSLLHLLSITGK